MELANITHIGGDGIGRSVLNIQKIVFICRNKISQVFVPLSFISKNKMLCPAEAAATIYAKSIISTNFFVTVIVSITQKRLNFNTFSRFCKNLFIMHRYYVNIVM